MSYEKHFAHADDLIAHLTTQVPTIKDDLLISKYVGFLAVAAVAVYESAIKDIFIMFAEGKHKTFGVYAANNFYRINGRISLENIKIDYLKKFGYEYLAGYKHLMEDRNQEYLRIRGREIEKSYDSLINIRNDFAHSTSFNTTATFNELCDYYMDGKEVIHCIAKTMER